MDTPDISSILSSLSEKDIESLKGAAQSIFGAQEQQPKEPPKQNNAFNSFDPKMLGKIGNIMSLLNSDGQDERCALINALKPLLSEERQHKADEAIKMVRLMELVPKLRDQGIF